jgi:hypothetical protein
MTPKFKPGNVFVEDRRGEDGLRGQHLVQIDEVYKQPSGAYLYKVKFDSGLYPEAELDAMERLLQVDW